MNRFLPAWFFRAALRSVACMLMVAQAQAQADNGTATVAQERETALCGHRYGAFAREFSEAGMPYCLHHDGLKRQPTMIGPLPVSGYLALPFIFIFIARARQVPVLAGPRRAAQYKSCFTAWA